MLCLVSVCSGCEKSIMKLILLIIFVLFKIIIFNAHAEKSVKDINSVRKKIIDITRQIMKIECEITETSKSNSVLIKQEANALSNILEQKKIGLTLQNLRHMQGSSPLFMAITSHSVDDLVKILILMQSLEPQLNSKYNNSLAQLKEISLNRSKMKENAQNFEKKKEELTHLENEQNELLTQKYHLFFRTSHNPNLEKFAKEHSTADSNIAQNFDDLVHQLQILFVSETVKSVHKLTLLLPVNGTLTTNSLGTTAQQHSAQRVKQDLSLMDDN